MSDTLVDHDGILSRFHSSGSSWIESEGHDTEWLSQQRTLPGLLPSAQLCIDENTVLAGIATTSVLDQGAISISKPLLPGHMFLRVHVKV